MNNLATIGQYLMNIQQQMAGLYGSIDEVKRELKDVKSNFESFKSKQEVLGDRVGKIEELNSTLESIFSTLNTASDLVPTLSQIQPTPLENNTTTETSDILGNAEVEENKQELEDLVMVPKKTITKRKINKK